METVKGIKNQFNNKNNNDEIHSFIQSQIECQQISKTHYSYSAGFVPPHPLPDVTMQGFLFLLPYKGGP